jgi:hypothetical protein
MSMPEIEAQEKVRVAKLAVLQNHLEVVGIALDLYIDLHKAQTIPEQQSIDEIKTTYSSINEQINAEFTNRTRPDFIEQIRPKIDELRHTLFTRCYNAFIEEVARIYDLVPEQPKASDVGKLSKLHQSLTTFEHKLSQAWSQFLQAQDKVQETFALLKVFAAACGKIADIKEEAMQFASKLKQNVLTKFFTKLTAEEVKAQERESLIQKACDVHETRHASLFPL